MPRRKNIRPERGPRNVLCVVVVITSAYSNGLGMTLPATKPLMWAISANNVALTSSQTWRRYKSEIINSKVKKMEEIE